MWYYLNRKNRGDKNDGSRSRIHQGLQLRCSYLLRLRPSRPSESDGEVTQDLARCYCGWAESGGDGYEELLEMGEYINDDVWDDAPYDF